MISVLILPIIHLLLYVRIQRIAANPRGRNNWWLLARAFLLSFSLSSFECPYSINLMTPIDADKPLTKKRCILRAHHTHTYTHTQRQKKVDTKQKREKRNVSFTQMPQQWYQSKVTNTNGPLFPLCTYKHRCVCVFIINWMVARWISTLMKV